MKYSVMSTEKPGPGDTDNKHEEMERIIMTENAAQWNSLKLESTGKQNILVCSYYSHPAIQLMLRLQTLNHLCIESMQISDGQGEMSLPNHQGKFIVLAKNNRTNLLIPQQMQKKTCCLSYFTPSLEKQNDTRGYVYNINQQKSSERCWFELPSAKGFPPKQILCTTTSANRFSRDNTGITGRAATRWLVSMLAQQISATQTSLRL